MLGRVIAYYGDCEMGEINPFDYDDEVIQAVKNKKGRVRTRGAGHWFVIPEDTGNTIRLRAVVVGYDSIQGVIIQPNIWYWFDKDGLKSEKITKQFSKNASNE